MSTLTVLGCSNAWPQPGEPTSGYLLQAPGLDLLLDCGHGVLGRLREGFAPEQLDGVWLSHTHPDHCADLVALAHYLLYHPHSRPGHRPSLWVPQGELARLRQWFGLWGWSDALERAFVCGEVDDQAELELGGWQLTSAWMPHSVPTLAVDVRGPNRARFTYSGDCGLNPHLARLAQASPLLLIEATLPVASEDHLSARAAGEIARQAGAQRCVLTHLCDAYDLAWVSQEGEAGFGRPVELARPGLSWQL